MANVPTGNSKRVASVLAALASLCIALFVAPTWASFEFDKPRWDSTTRLLELARKQLGEQRVVLSPQLDWGRLQPADAVLILHPDARLQFSELSAFLAGGGRVALLDDFGKGDQALTRFHIHRSSAPTKPLESWLDKPALQYARPAESFNRQGTPLRHPMVEGIEFVVTNHPSALHTDPNVELTPVLTLSSESGNQALFAVIGVIGDAVACGLDDGRPRHPRARCGRLFAMADPSVFIDLMMQFEGNQRLASGLLKYLLEDDAWGKRDGKLYIVANDFSQTGAFGDDDSLQRQLDDALDTLSGWLGDARTEGLPPRVVWLLVLAASIAVVGAVWRISGKVYERPSPRYAASPARVAQGGVAGRAAVLAAPSTSRALVVLELKNGIEEFLKWRLRLPRRTAAHEILATVEQRGLLDVVSSRKLGSLFQQMLAVERSMVTAHPARVSTETIEQMRAQIAQTTELVDSQLRRTP